MYTAMCARIDMPGSLQSVLDVNVCEGDSTRGFSTMLGRGFFLLFFLFVRDKDEVICTFGNERERVNVWENWNLMVTGGLGLFI